jgi:hypothetical protein
MNLELINRIYYLEKEIERLETLETAVGAGGSAFTLISSQRLVAPAARITFSNIPASYTHIFFIGSLRTANVFFGEDIALTFNNIAFPNAAYVSTNTSGSTWGFSNSQIASRLHLGACPDSTSPAGFYGPFNLWVYWYTKIDRNRMAKSLYGYGAKTPAGVPFGVNASCGTATSMWRNTASAVNRVDFIPLWTNFLAGCQISMFGVN